MKKIIQMNFDLFNRLLDKPTIADLKIASETLKLIEEIAESIELETEIFEHTESELRQKFLFLADVYFRLGHSRDQLSYMSSLN
jgi:hypothetical protein